ncbi:MAG: hypothetical protein VKO21_07855 [Candidatus Sericytochromatia bacterium]|nr:hypothetical protein [Candidatus Sericytochromatia bacterium]
MKNFAVVQDHFRKLRCAHCSETFQPEGVHLIREERDYWVVKVHCTACDQPAGVAIVGVEYDLREPADSQATVTRPRTTVPARPLSRAKAVFTDAREEERFASMQPITEDEVLDVHRFLKSLGSDWSGQLRKAGRGRS